MLEETRELWNGLSTSLKRDLTEIVLEEQKQAPLTDVKDAAREAKNINQELMSISRMKQATLKDILVELRAQTKSVQKMSEHLGKIAAKAEATGYITTTVG